MSQEPCIMRSKGQSVLHATQSRHSTPWIFFRSENNVTSWLLCQTGPIWLANTKLKCRLTRRLKLFLRSGFMRLELWKGDIIRLRNITPILLNWKNNANTMAASCSSCQLENMETLTEEIWVNVTFGCSLLSFNCNNEFWMMLFGTDCMIILTQEIWTPIDPHHKNWSLYWITKTCYTMQTRPTWCCHLGEQVSQHWHGSSLGKQSGNKKSFNWGCAVQLFNN